MGRASDTIMGSMRLHRPCLFGEYRGKRTTCESDP